MPPNLPEGARRRQAPAAGLRVFPPGQTAAKVVPIPITACRASVVYMDVQAVTKSPRA
jgi:hypothetical protein